jgi:hypothetical protein
MNGIRWYLDFARDDGSEMWSAAGGLHVWSYWEHGIPGRWAWAGFTPHGPAVRAATSTDAAMRMCEAQAAQKGAVAP